MARKSTKTTYALPECLDMTSLDILHQELLGHIDKAALVLEASNVHRLSTAAVQLLLSCARSMEQQGHVLTFKKPSAVMQLVFEQLGLSAELQQRKAS